ncbi:hypothetical protein BKH34_01245 [Actinomyces naeslundii]|nr:hypothetical protein BKH34_01245 [Actinomyces naeslundii]
MGEREVRPTASGLGIQRWWAEQEVAWWQPKRLVAGFISCPRRIFVRHLSAVWREKSWLVVPKEQVVLQEVRCRRDLTPSTTTP